MELIKRRTPLLAVAAVAVALALAALAVLGSAGNPSVAHAKTAAHHRAHAKSHRAAHPVRHHSVRAQQVSSDNEQSGENESSGERQSGGDQQQDGVDAQGDHQCPPACAPGEQP